MKTFSNIHIITKLDSVYKKVFAEANSVNIQISRSSSFKEIETYFNNFDLIFSDFEFLKHFKSIRDRIVVIDPANYTRRLLDKGYTRFLFNKDDRNEILACLVTVENFRGKEAEEAKKIERTNKFEYLGLKMDFKKALYVYKGDELYITPAQHKYLYTRFYLKDKTEANKLRINLHRLRKKFGEDFLKEV